MAFLEQILQDTRREIAAAKKLRSTGDLKRMIRDAPTVRGFGDSLSEGFGLIAEIKRRSPSGGDMREENFQQAPKAYSKSRVVKAVSVLTNSTHFGMEVQDLLRVKAVVKQPVLRKEFLLDDYQIYEARAFGADAVLLMATVLNDSTLKRLFELSQELSLDVLFEAHTMREIERAPEGVRIYGINSRNFKASKKWLMSAKLLRSGRSGKPPARDLSVELDAFSLVKHLPRTAIKVAESGVAPEKVCEVAAMGYDAVLVGTSLLKAPAGIRSMLRAFEDALQADAALPA